MDADGPVERIAILRANALGDLLLTLPAIDALRAAHPAAQITLLGGPWHASFLDGRPSPIDDVVVVPAARGVRDVAPHASHAQLESFFAAMRRRRFDLALQLHGGGRYSNPFVRRLGASVTAGLQADDAPPLDLSVRYLPLQHEILRFLEIAALVGGRAASLEPRIAVTDADRENAARAIAPCDAPIAVLHPGAMDGRRRWSPRRFAEIGDRLRESGFRVVLTGSASERRLVRLVAAAMQRPAQDLAGALSLGGLAALLESAQLVVSSDTGPRHLAAAVGTPTVAVYWFRNVVNTAPLGSGRHRILVAWRSDCPVCGGQLLDAAGADIACLHRRSLLGEVTVDRVWQAIEELLDETADDRAARHRAATRLRPAR